MNRFSSALRCMTALACGLAAGAALAQTSASHAWARATVPAQRSGGAYLTLRSPDAARLLSASSPAAGNVALHSMQMQGSTMSMREMAAVDLPAGKAVSDFHVMLMDLKGPLKEGAAVPLELVIEHAGGKRETLKVSVPVKALTYQAAH